MDVIRVGAFGAGVMTGLIGFSKGLGWVFRRHRTLAILLLSGFLIGSLRKLWPWKENVSALFTHSDGRVEFLQANILPAEHANPQNHGGVFVCRFRCPPRDGDWGACGRMGQTTSARG